MKTEVELVMTLNVELKTPYIEIGQVNSGFLRMIPIIGGTFAGEKLNGEIVPGGYDWNTVISEDIQHVYARYAIKTDDGTYISVTNEGWIDLRNPNKKFITNPRFEVIEGKYGWLKNCMMLGAIEVVSAEKVIIKIFKVIE